MTVPTRGGQQPTEAPRPTTGVPSPRAYVTAAQYYVSMQSNPTKASGGKTAAPMSTFGLPVSVEGQDELFEPLSGFMPDLAEVSDGGAVSAMIAGIVAKMRPEQDIAVESGRWALGQADPTVFNPGDVPMLRALYISPQLRVAAQRIIEAQVYRSKIQDRGPAAAEALLRSLRSLQFDLAACKAVHTAVPFFLEAGTAEAVCGSHPIPADQADELRLPFEVTAVYFGADLAIDRRLVCAPPELEKSLRREMLARQAFKEVLGPAATRTTTVAEDIDAWGGYLTGLVLFARQDGGLSDTVAFLATANPDKSLPPPMCYDRIRGFVIGRLSHSYLGAAARNIATLVCHADWQTLPTSTPPDLSTRAGRRSLRHGSTRRAIARGEFANGLHVLELKTSPQRQPVSAKPDGSPRASPREHLRRGHFQRVAVGPRAEGGRKQIWKPPQLVSRGVGERRQTVYMVPAPPWMDDIPRPPEAGRGAL